MFCNQCGAPLEEGANFCTRCGKRVGQGVAPAPPGAAPSNASPAHAESFAAGVSVPPPQAAYPAPARTFAAPDGRVARHLNILAIFWAAYAVLRLFGVFWLFMVGRIAFPAFLGPIISLSDPIGRHNALGWMFSQTLGLIAAWIGFWAALQLVAAWGLFARTTWARHLILVLGILSVLRFPLGTVMCVYTLWVLLPASAAMEYDRLAQR